MELGLAETMDALRRELSQAVVAGAGAEFQFPIEGVQLEFHVAVTKEAGVDGKVKVWVVELGGSGSVAREEIQTVTLTLGAPRDRNGQLVKITRGSDEKP